ncbi:MAG: carboxypeptidase regulatory-like domain-containing protein [Clostridium sp.]|nr:carboxypeptidase regulatory-like domain-containing protein [Bacteroides sp.]MCM1198256.1 carboxypeptidase regulatory-like domain-containing protein [Clostridium sp.]
MLRKLIVAFAALLCSVSLFAQASGGVKGTVVNRSGRIPVVGAMITISQNGEVVASEKVASDGKFLFEGLDDGMYAMSVKAPGFNDVNVNVTVDKGFVKDLIFVSMVASQSLKDVDDSSFIEFDMEDSGYTDNPTILFGSNDVYNNLAGYGFSAIRFKNRGYNSETQDVYLSGVKMNDAITGYSPYSLWSGLNEAMRSKETTMGVEASDYGIGGYNGVTNILANPASVRPGWRFSVLSNSALYRLRLMANYASGELDNGWSYAVNVSARIGGNDWIKGVYYRNFAYYAGVEKKINDIHRLSLATFATPGQRGAQNASTQEVYDLMGDNMYNSNWGYQNGKVRNARVRRTFEPVTVLKYTATPSDKVEASATILYRTGFNGYSALDWYDAMDPRPDYYRNLPSYAWMEDDDYNRLNETKYAWAKEMWTNHTSEYANYQHLNWDRMYNVNFSNESGRSKYALEERHVDQHDVNVAANVKWRASSIFTLTGGADFKWNRTENYKKIKDLLGGQYYVNIDQFAERDFASSEALIQNDLDYWMAHGAAEKITTGGKYGYDYYAQVRNAGLWANGLFEVGGFTGNVALSAGYESFWREGLMRKGLFAGLDDNGNEIEYAGKVLTTYDSNGKVITSKGKSDVSRFFTYSAKIGAAYTFTGGHRISLNAGYFNDAPTFSQAFISPRTRNTLIPNLTTQKTVSTDLSYQWNSNGYNIRVTGFWTKIMDQTDVMSFYDDSQNSFTNFSMTGIDQRHAGIEFGAQIPLFVQGLSLSAAVSWGEYVYTSNPRMTQTVDNSAEVIFDNQEVPYWKSHPVFRTAVLPDGSTAYEVDLNGNPVVERQQKHYVAGTPQLATCLALNYRTNSYWFFEVNGQYFTNSYLDMNPLYRTEMAVSGPDGVASPAEIEYMAAQEKFDPVFLLNASLGKSWYIQRKYSIGFSLEVKNILNNRNVKTGGYEQTRLISSSGKDRYYRFDPKYFYMCGANYMLNIYFRF